MDNQPAALSPNTMPPSTFTQTPQIPEVETPPKKHQVRRIVIGVIIVLLAIPLIIAGTLLIGSQQIKAAKKVSDTFVQDIDTNNVSAAYSLTTPTFQQTTTEAQLASLAQGVQQHITGQPVENSWKITNQTGQPQSAVITYSTNGTNPSPIIVTLQKINGNWLVLNYSYNK